MWIKQQDKHRTRNNSFILQVPSHSVRSDDDESRAAVGNNVGLERFMNNNDSTMTKSQENNNVDMIWNSQRLSLTKKRKSTDSDHHHRITRRRTAMQESDTLCSTVVIPPDNVVVSSVKRSFKLKPRPDGLMPAIFTANGYQQSWQQSLDKSTSNAVEMMLVSSSFSDPSPDFLKARTVSYECLSPPPTNRCNQATTSCCCCNEEENKENNRFDNNPSSPQLQSKIGTMNSIDCHRPAMSVVGTSKTKDVITLPFSIQSTTSSKKRSFKLRPRGTTSFLPKVAFQTPI